MSDVMVSFDGDVNKLKSAISSADRSVTDSVSRMKDSVNAASPAFKQLQESLDQLNATAAQTSSSARTLETYANLSFYMSVASGTAHVLGSALNIAYEGTKLVGTGAVYAGQSATSATASFLQYAKSQASVAEYSDLVKVANTGLIASLGQLVERWDRYWQSVALVTSGLERFSGAIIAASGNMQRFDATMRSGGFDNATTAIQAYTEKLVFSGKVTNEVAAQIVASFGSIPGITEPMMTALVEMTTHLNGTKDQIKQITAELANALANPSTAGDTFLRSQQDVTAEMLKQFDAAKRTNDVTGMQKVILLEMLEKEKIRYDEKSRVLREQIEYYNKQNGIVRLLLPDIRQQAEEHKKVREAIERQIDALKVVIDQSSKLPGNFEQAAKAANDIVNNLNPLSNQLDNLNGKLTTLQSGMRSTSGGNPLGGWWTPERVNHAIARLQAEAKLSEVGAAALVGRWASVEASGGPSSVNPTSGAFGIAQWLGSRKEGIAGNTDFDAQLKHAIDELNSSERAAAEVLRNARTPDEGRRGASMYERAEGYNASTGRDNFTDRTAVPSKATQAEIEAQQQLKDAIVEKNNAIQGGNNVALAQAEVTDRAAKGQKDSVRDAQQMVEAWKKDLEQANTATTKLQMQNGLHQAQITLKERQLELAKSKHSLESLDNDTAKQKLDSANKLFEMEMKAAGNDVGLQNQALAKKKAAQQQYEQEITRLEQEAENSRFQLATQDLNRRRSKLQEDLQARRITNQQKLQADLALEQEQTTLEQEHYKKLRDLETEGTLSYQQAQNRLTQITAESATRRQQIVTQDSRKIQQEYEKAFSSIGSSMTSSIMGMIQGTMTLKQALTNILMSIVQLFVKAGVDMLMHWAANQAKMLMSTIATQSSTTAAVAAGTAAKTATQAAGAATGAAIEKSTAAATVSTSAGKAGAGAYSAVVGIPIIGPVLAPIAAATAFAGTMAFGAFDSGSWSVPGDQIAAIHKGEMIVPSRGGLAEEFRDMASGGMSKKGDQYNINLGFLDTTGARSFIRRNTAQMTAAIVSHMNLNPGVRPKY